MGREGASKLGPGESGSKLPHSKAPAVPSDDHACYFEGGLGLGAGVTASQRESPVCV